MTIKTVRIRQTYEAQVSVHDMFVIMCVIFHITSPWSSLIVTFKGSVHPKSNKANTCTWRTFCLHTEQWRLLEKWQLGNMPANLSAFDGDQQTAKPDIFKQSLSCFQTLWSHQTVLFFLPIVPQKEDVFNPLCNWFFSQTSLCFSCEDSATKTSCFTKTLLFFLPS